MNSVITEAEILTTNIKILHAKECKYKIAKN